MRDPVADRADHPRRNEEPFVDVALVLLAVAAVEHLVARESADLLAGLHGAPAHAAEVAQVPLQSRDAAERRDTQPSRQAPVAHDQHVGDHGDPQGHADDDVEDVDHDDDDDGHHNAQAGEHWSPAPHGSCLFSFRSGFPARSRTSFLDCAVLV
jgi:hypothetical protein